MVLNKYVTWLVFFAAAFSPAAHASLGGDIGSVSQDRTQAKTLMRSQTMQGYTVHETLTESGTMVREYAGANSKVFAVTWAGPLMPDLRQLLGPYFPQYIVDSDERRGGHARRSVRHGDLVVYSAGRMRAFSGVAYLESAIPNGVQIDALR